LIDKISKIHKIVKLNKDMSMSWCNLSDTKPGDFVATKRKADLWGDGNPSPELCRLLGYLVAEGSVTETRVSISNTCSEVINDYVNCFEKVFGERLSISWKSQPSNFGGCEIAIIESRAQRVIDYMKELGMQHYSHTKEVPYIIRTAKKECVFEFLKALFEGDGSIPDVEKKQSVYYSSVSPDLLEQVHLLLLNAGIVSMRYPAYKANGDRGPKCKNSDRHLFDNIPTIQIHSEYVTDYMDQIGFVSERKNNTYKDYIARHRFRCGAHKIPYLTANLSALKSKTNGDGAWVKHERSIDHTQEVYSVKEVAKLLGRDVSSILIYIRTGKLNATKEERTDGRYCTSFIQACDIDSFLELHGTQKRASVGQTTWEINDNNMNYVNWDSVKTLDPELYDRYQQLKKEDHIWDQVESTSHSMEEVEMCDLTVFNTHSYVANGIVSHNTGSSISLRTLENDFIQNRSQLLDLVHWVKDKMRVWLSLPHIKDIKFADFRMADDVQRNQQLIGMNAQRKVSDQTMLTELGYDWEQEQRKMIGEVQFQNYINDLMAKGGAKTQGEAGLIQYNYQTKIQELAQKAEQDMQKKLTKMREDGVPMPPMPQAGGAEAGAGWQSQEQTQLMGTSAEAAPGEMPQVSTQGSMAAQMVDQDIRTRVIRWAQKLQQMDPNTAQETLFELKNKMPDIGNAVEAAYNELAQQMGMAVAGQPALPPPQQPQQPAGGGATTPSGAPSQAGSIAPLPQQRAPGGGKGLV